MTSDQRRRGPGEGSTHRVSLSQRAIPKQNGMSGVDDVVAARNESV